MSPFASTRRGFLSDLGLGFGSIAAARMLQQVAQATMSSQITQLAPKAKSVIWLFMISGTSHMESFVSKPALTKYAGMTIDETPFKSVLSSPYLESERVVAFDPNNGFIRNELYPLQMSWRRWGASGLEICDWWPHVARQADDLCLVRSVWTEDSNHGAQHGDGRDHHPYGFTVWMAGGGIKGGMAHGATDEIGFHAVEDRHYVTDIHATLLHQLGLYPRELTIPGRKRLEKEFGNPIHEVIA